MAHTPGPWVVGKTTNSKIGEEIIGVTIDGGASGFPISTLSDATETDWANAHLVAAAPELLKALEAALEALCWYNAEMFEYGGRTVGEQARAAIAKATGQTG